MAQKKSTPKSLPSPRNNLGGKREMITLENILELPDGAGFESKRVNVSLNEMIRWCESCLPEWNAEPGAEEARLRDKIDVEFVL